MKKNEERVSLQLLKRKSPKPMFGIVLFGESNCGKSSTLQHLIVLLCGGGSRKASIQNAFENAFYDKNNNRYRDVSVIVHYQTAEGKKIPIYVSTDGDNWQMVEDNFRFFYQCVLKPHKVYEFDGKKFVKIDHEELKAKPRPEICINPANITQYGGIQAQRYYQDLTCEDWQGERWIRKYPCRGKSKPVPGYQKIKKICEHDENVALEIIDIMNQMQTRKYV